MTARRGSLAGMVRYVAADAARSQRWIAPVVLFAVAVALANSDAGPVLTTYADTLTCLLPTGMWLAWTVVNAEDPVQADVSAASVGGATRYRLGKLLTAFLACACLAVVAVVAPYAVGAYRASTSGGTVIGDLAAGLAGHLLVALAAVAGGALASRPVIRRAGWSFYLLTAVTLAEIVVPHAPPVRQLLSTFDRDHPTHVVGSLVVTGAETLLLSAILVATALAIARWRS